ncbi:hypothetical protein F0T03_00465 [Yersinia canariae]|uniref:Tox-PL domain-containing protein n=1 Tax=Yersinia canariae TaxID=2607663 RepID=A0A857ETG9_9GAMM|nr:hypothetical protein [Yersinia canariae]QHB30830.1 hypothetical protein F0T03_00465 [Yersinia canariae]
MNISSASNFSSSSSLIESGENNGLGINNPLLLQSSKSLNDESFHDMNCHYLGNLDTYTPPSLAIANEKASFGIKPSNYGCFVTKQNYLTNYLLDIVNREGKPPLLLRPLAALLKLFGLHGFGQTNCASCATAVAETLERNEVYLAMPKLRGADVKGNMGLPFESAASASELISQLEKYQTADELNGVLVIHRPAMLSLLPGAKQGHACNLIKFKDSNFVHFFDAQKKTYLSCDLASISDQVIEIRKFLGPVGADGIDLYQKGFHKSINEKPEW